MEEITTLAEWEEQLEQSRERPFFLFKHSTRCPISSRAYDQVQRFLEKVHFPKPLVFLVKVIESRLVSNAIADTLGIIHKSPQIILLSEGRGIWSTSHYNITEANLSEAISEIREKVEP